MGKHVARRTTAREKLDALRRRQILMESDFQARVADMTRHHHRRMKKLFQAETPLIARINKETQDEVQLTEKKEK